MDKRVIKIQLCMWNWKCILQIPDISSKKESYSSYVCSETQKHARNEATLHSWSCSLFLILSIQEISNLFNEC